MKPSHRPCRKIKYETPQLAHHSLQVCLNKTSGINARAEQGYYYCSQCTAWHLTKQQNNPTLVFMNPTLDHPAIIDTQFALLYNREVVEIEETHRIEGESTIDYYKVKRNHPDGGSVSGAIHPKEITPLHEVEILSKLMAKSINSISEETPLHIYSDDPDWRKSTMFYEKNELWVQAEEMRLNLPFRLRIDVIVKYSSQCHANPGTRWLAYQENSKWYIVKQINR